MTPHFLILLVPRAPQFLKDFDWNIHWLIISIIGHSHSLTGMSLVDVATLDKHIASKPSTFANPHDLHINY